MKIRSITYFCNPGYPLDGKIIDQAAGFLEQAKGAYQAAGYEVQTTRLATIPFPLLLGEEHIAELPRLAAQLAGILRDVGLGYASLGPALPSMPGSYELIPDAIAASENVFFGGLMTGRDPGSIHTGAVQACAEVIVRSAPITPDGFANLRFAALANVPPGAPFLPAAYYQGDGTAFAIATEAADLAVNAFDDVASAEEGREKLTREIEKHGQAIANVASTQLWNVEFGGIDFSLAPFPDDAHSLGHAVEKMGIPLVGLHGSLTAAALLTQAIENADFPHCGFSGFMQPVLEDSVLAARAAQGSLTIKDVLLYSAVCGTGLDTIPLPGDTTAGQLYALLMDLSALALRLDKPLTARLMPVPGKKAGDRTEFDFGFFANSRVMGLDSEGLNGPLAGKQTIALSPRRQ